MMPSEATSCSWSVEKSDSSVEIDPQPLQERLFTYTLIVTIMWHKKIYVLIMIIIHTHTYTIQDVIVTKSFFHYAHIYEH